MPKTTVGEKSPNTDFKLTNTSGGTVSVSSVNVIGPSEFLYAGGNCTGALTAGAECSVGISFAPQATGSASGTLEISFADGSVEFLPLSGQAVEAEIAFVPALADFGVVGPREQTTTTLHLVNEGEAPVHPSGSSIDGPGASRFAADFNGCQSLTLNPGDNCSVPVRFEPQGRGSYEATLHAAVGAGSAAAALVGRGGGSLVEPVLPLPGFGSVTVGTAGVVRTVTIANHGDLPANFFISILSGGDAASFQLISENCTGHELVPAATCSAQVRFAPLSAGPKAATLSFFGEAEGGGQIALDGVGVGARASLSSGGLGFGSTAVGRRSAPLQITVRNGGTESIETGAIAFGGADLDQFTLSGDECSGTMLLPGAECALRVRFAPDSAGAKNATLRVAIPGGTLTASLSGIANAKPKKHKHAHRRHRTHRKHHHHRGHRNR